MLVRGGPVRLITFFLVFMNNKIDGSVSKNSVDVTVRSEQ